MNFPSFRVNSDLKEIFKLLRKLRISIVSTYNNNSKGQCLIPYKKGFIGELYNQAFSAADANGFFFLLFVEVLYDVDRV